LESILRNTDLLTLETLLLTGCLVLLTVAKTSHENRFPSFLMLFFTNKYLKIYGKDKGLVLNRFNILLFVIQAVVFGIILKITTRYFSVASIDSSPLWVFILMFVMVVLFKFYLEKLIAYLFGIEPFIEQYHFLKLSYRNLIAIIMLPLAALVIYAPIDKKAIILLTIFTFVTLNFITLILTLKYHQKLIAGQLFYFILYLCALEIAPYLIMVKWVITNGSN